MKNVSMQRPHSAPSALGKPTFQKINRDAQTDRRRAGKQVPGVKSMDAAPTEPGNRLNR